MKSLFLVLLLGLYSNYLYAQDLNFPTSNATWKYFCYDHTSSIVDWNTQTFSGDSIVNNIIYAKISNSGVFLFGDDDGGLIRTQSNQVFFIPKDSLNEILLYDFDLEEGDFFTTMEDWFVTESDSLLVTKVDSILTADGNYRKRIEFETGTYWIEGIGSDYGSITRPWYLPSLSGDCNLNCFSTDTSNIFEKIYSVDMWGSTVSYGCEGLISTTEDVRFEKEIEVFPNPFSDHLTIHRPAEAIDNIQLFTLDYR